MSFQTLEPTGIKNRSVTSIDTIKTSNLERKTRKLKLGSLPNIYEPNYIKCRIPQSIHNLQNIQQVSNSTNQTVDCISSTIKHKKTQKIKSKKKLQNYKGNQQTIVPIKVKTLKLKTQQEMFDLSQQQQDLVLEDLVIDYLYLKKTKKNYLIEQKVSKTIRLPPLNIKKLLEEEQEEDRKTQSVILN